MILLPCTDVFYIKEEINAVTRFRERYSDIFLVAL
jgi:hypothetical protein